MYQIHTTPGFIIGSRPSGEAGKVIFILTRELGLIHAFAQGIRLERSKLRPFIQDYSFGIFSFVRGKELWRLTSAQEYPEIRGYLDGAKEGLAMMARIASLLERLLRGEQAHPELFDCIVGTSCFLTDHSVPREKALDPETLDVEALQTLESLTVIRILYRLGYIGDAADLDRYIISMDIDMAILNVLKGKRKAMNEHINKALRESHL
jgi:hypothetical protein